jgi:hypothetical protein
MNELLNELLSSSKANNKLLREVRTDIAFSSLGKKKILEIHEDGKRINFYIPFADRDYIQRRILSSFSFYEIGLLRKIKPIYYQWYESRIRCGCKYWKSLSIFLKNLQYK